MWKASLFIFGGTALICATYFYNPRQFHLPSLDEVSDQYQIKKIKQENLALKMRVHQLEFTVARYEAATTIQLPERSVASTDESKDKTGYEIFPSGKVIEDVVKQEIYNWSPTKLHSLLEKEFSLNNYVAAAQYGMTLLNTQPDFELVDDDFYYKVGVSCVQSGIYTANGIKALSFLVSRYPESPLLVKAKLWRGLAYHRMNNQQEFTAMMEEFKQKYRNTQEWTVLKNIYERGLASGSAPAKAETNDKKVSHEE